VVLFAFTAYVQHFEQVYDFVRREPFEEVVAIPSAVCTELAVSSFLMPLLGADLRRTFVPFLTACDASSVFGFGVSFMKVKQSVATQVGSLAERRGDFVMFYNNPGEPEPRDRLGNPHLLPFSQSNFKVAISARAKFQAHSGALEAHGCFWR
jgi:hypothetical protein